MACAKRALVMSSRYKQKWYSIDELSGKFGNLKVGPGGDAEGSFEIVDTIGQSVEGQAPIASGMKLFKNLQKS